MTIEDLIRRVNNNLPPGPMNLSATLLGEIVSLTLTELGIDPAGDIPEKRTWRPPGRSRGVNNRR